jgi:hypothetical protein
MALAIKMQGMVDRGEVRDYAELARLAQVTRARMTQIMNLNLLSPQLQEWLLFLESESGRDSVTLKGLQKVCLQSDWKRQKAVSIRSRGGNHLIDGCHQTAILRPSRNLDRGRIQQCPMDTPS